MSKLMKKGSVWVFSLVAVMLAAFLFIPTVYADTDGTELKVTAQPDRLELQLGSDWAGAEFELKLDSGIFPVPVVVNDTGVLNMDLGGSKTYTLRLLTSPAGSEVDPAQPESPAQSAPPSPEQPAPSVTPAAEASNEGIPPMHLILFIGGLILGVGGLILMYVLKKRREYYDDDEDYEYGDEDE